jgi:hypothetical protein
MCERDSDRELHRRYLLHPLRESSGVNSPASVICKGLATAMLEVATRGLTVDFEQKLEKKYEMANG